MTRSIYGVQAGKLGGAMLRVGTGSLGRGPRVDRDSGTISGVPIAETGLVYPANAEPFYLDAESLRGMLQAIRSASPPLKVRVTHPGLEQRDGVARTVGIVDPASAEIVDGRLVGTIQLGSYAVHTELGNMREYLLGIAAEHPGSVGLSVVFGDGELVPLDGFDRLVARPLSLLAIDVVGEPAANAAGMLSRGNAAALGSSQNQAAATVRPMITPAQLDYLRSLGLQEGATDAEIQSFIDGLSAEQLSAFEAAAASASESETETAAAADSTTEAIAAAGGRGGSGSGFYSTVAARNRTDGIQAERARVRALSDIATAARMPATWLSRAIAEGWSVDRARSSAVRDTSEQRTPTPAQSVNVGQNRQTVGLVAAITDSIMLRTGHRTGDIVLGSDGRPEFSPRAPHERVREFRSLSLLEIGRRFLEATGRRTVGLSRTELADALMERRASSRRISGVSLLNQAPAETGATADFPLILGSTLNKALMTAFTTAPRIWRQFCSSRTVADYKPIKSLQLGDAELAAVTEGDDYTFVKLTEYGESWQLAKYGKGVAFTREALVNDDASAFDRVPAKLGFAAAQVEDSVAFAQLQVSTMHDAVALYHASHGNLEAVQVGPPTLSLLSLGIAAIRAQTADGSTQPLDIAPGLVIVPAELDGVARQLVYGAVDPAGTLGANPYQGELRVVSSARLAPNAWYMACLPGQLIDTVELAFLEGESEPQVSEMEDFSSEVMLWKVRHSVAAKALDWRGLWKNNGT